MSDHQPHVLVVEDNEAVVSAMRILLDSAGYLVTSARSIAEALGLREVFDLVLLDLRLPDGDGLSLIPPLKAAGSHNIVALTGHDDHETRTRCLAAGCVDVLVKPVPARELVAKVGVLLG